MKKTGTKSPKNLRLSQARRHARSYPAAKKVSASDHDIIKLIKRDHKPLRKLLEVLKDIEIDAKKRQVALIEFAPLLLNHARSEERALYQLMEKKEELRADSYQGVVEHHLDEEEEEVLPDYKKQSTSEERILVGKRYLQFKKKFEDADRMDEVDETTDEAITHVTH